MFAKVIIGNKDTGKVEKLYHIRKFHFDDMMKNFNEVEDLNRSGGGKHIDPAGHITMEYLDGEVDVFPLDEKMLDMGIQVYIMNEEGQTIDSFRWGRDVITGHVRMDKLRRVRSV